MPEQPANWPRPHYERPGGRPLLFYVVHGQFDNLSKIAQSNNLRIGGSLADIERCTAAKLHIERVMSRIKQYGDGSLGYLPSFEMITHPTFIPHDQAGWWLINDWAKE